ncbi:prepilin-type N-terminal cleavage/methylation domain-containing protein [Myxococcota bacterium]|nr:prepilin-type N-terminal cleavage/methylation domain-containing protein [Myxococcota bacterium]
MRRAHRSDAFTLLEVLAAVAVLAIWFLVIASTAIQGVRAEGLSRRRLEAALIADRRLSEIETSALDGSLPPNGSEESEEPPFGVVVSIGPFVLENSVPANPNGAADAPGLEPLLARDLAARSQDLKRVDVQIIWEEAGQQQAVEPTSFIFDLESAVAAYDEAGIPSPDDVPLETETGEEEVEAEE